MGLFGNRERTLRKVMERAAEPIDEAEAKRRQYSWMMLSSLKELYKPLKKNGMERKCNETARQFIFRSHLQGNVKDAFFVYYFLELERAFYSDVPFTEKELGIGTGYLEEVQRSFKIWKKLENIGAERLEKAIWYSFPSSTEYPDIDLEFNDQIRKGCKEVRDDILIGYMKKKRCRPLPIMDKDLVLMRKLIRTCDCPKMLSVLKEYEDDVESTRSPYMGPSFPTYAVEIGMRYNELMKADYERIEANYHTVLSYAQIMASFDGRDFLIPDDIKFSFMLFASEELNVAPESSMRIVDSVPVHFLRVPYE